MGGLLREQSVIIKSFQLKVKLKFALDLKNKDTTGRKTDKSNHMENNHMCVIKNSFRGSRFGMSS
jgi:hypothetical protein